MFITTQKDPNATINGFDKYEYFTSRMAAMRIVKMAAPYAPFPPDIRKDYDVIEITRTWTFTNSDQVRAN